MLIMIYLMIEEPLDSLGMFLVFVSSDTREQRRQEVGRSESVKLFFKVYMMYGWR